MKIEFEKGDLKVSTAGLIEAMPTEIKKSVLKELCVQSDIIRMVIDYICGEDPDGWWQGGASDIRHEIITRCEEKQLSSAYYSWKPFDDLRTALKDIRAKEHVYWLIYHKAPEDIRYRISDLMRQHGVESNYTTKQADDDILEIKQMLKDTLKNMQQKEQK